MSMAMYKRKIKVAWPPEEGEIHLLEAVQRILTEEAVHTEVNYSADISAEEHQRIVHSIEEDANETASDIASYIYFNKEEFAGTNGDWTVVGDKIQTFFACKFIKESVVISGAKMRKKLMCFTYKKPPLDNLIVAATKVVKTMTPPDNGQDDVGFKRLVKVILENLPPDHGTAKYNQNKVSTEVSTLMTSIRNWFNQQNNRKGSVTESVAKIRSVVEKQLTEAKDCSVIVTPVITLVSSMSDEEDPESLDEDKEDKLPEEELPEQPEPITDSTGQTEPPESTDLFYTVLTSAVVHVIIKNSSAGFQLSSDAIKNMTLTLQDVLRAEMAGSESVKTKVEDVKKIAKDVYKKLCKKMGNKNYVAMNLISRDSLIYAHIAQAIKGRLMKPKKTGVKRFFSSIQKIVTKPFTPGSNNMVPLPLQHCGLA
ncbi:hypothetical protein GBF38_012543 [Nibea albiflora]|uniref:Uncharacterized protein n=1 Tax=Nibea albiflora TaxID=240163 RepID=A0ACB7EJS0_NIBAL|nr:hypothetical protein GBF38_012543 [Nibea albiflora]